MHNVLSSKSCEQARFSAHFRRPLYDSYCFSRIPNSVLRLFEIGHAEDCLPVDVFGGSWPSVQNVVLIFLDSVGWNMLRRSITRKESAIAACIQRGILSQITSQFPSTTINHLIATHCNLTALSTGIYGWYYYDAHFDEVIAPLPFEFAGQEGRSLFDLGIKPESVFPPGGFYGQLARQGISSYIVEYEGYRNSPFSRVIRPSTNVVSYKDPEEGLNSIRDLLQSRHSQRNYVLGIFDHIDSLCHREGPLSENVFNAIECFFSSLITELLDPMRALASETVVIVTADHGQTEVDYKKTVYLDTAFPKLAEKFKKNRKGRTIAPLGSVGDYFIHVDLDLLEDVHGELQEHLQGVAEVWPTSQLIEEGIFGKGEPSTVFLQNIGQLVVLPFEQQSVFWAGDGGRFHRCLRGRHGGLTPDEMDSHFLVLASDTNR